MAAISCCTRQPCLLTDSRPRHSTHCVILFSHVSSARFVSSRGSRSPNLNVIVGNWLLVDFCDLFTVISSPRLRVPTFSVFFSRLISIRGPRFHPPITLWWFYNSDSIVCRRVYSIHQFPFSCYIFHQRSGIITLSFFLRPPGAQRPLLPPLTS